VLGNIFSIQDQLARFPVAIQLSSWTVVLDIFLVATILYSAYLLIKGTRALRILYGIGILVLLYVLAQFLQLAALNFLLRSVFAVTLVAIPVVFQPELRAALERLGRGELITSMLSRDHDESTLVHELALEVIQLAKKKIGALIVIERSTGLKDFVETGVPLNAEFSSQLIGSIFFPNNPLHDGAAIIRGNRVIAANVFLPLAEDIEGNEYGTRHRAAVGLSKETDAIVVVVSEETGRISIAHKGSLSAFSQDKIEDRLRRFLLKKRQVK